MRNQTKQFDIKELAVPFSHITCPESMREYETDWNNMHDGLMEWYKNVLDHADIICKESPESLAHWAQVEIGRTLATIHWNSPIDLTKTCYPSITYRQVAIERVTTELQRIEKNIDVWGILGVKKIEWNKLDENLDKILGYTK